MRARSSDEAENVSGHLGPASRNCRSSYGEVTELIINAAITHRAIVETTLADKYCTRLRKEERAVLRALSFLGGGSLKPSESFQAFRRCRRADRLSREWAEIHIPRVHGRWIVAVVSAGVGEQQSASIPIERISPVLSPETHLLPAQVRQFKIDLARSARRLYSTRGLR